MINNNKKAFTLAEVLVTLVTIGIVAALTIPVVVAKYNRKVVEVQLLKSYNTLFDAVKMSEMDNGPVSEWDYDKSEAGAFFNKYLTPYIKGSKGLAQNATLVEFGYTDGIKYANGQQLKGSTKTKVGIKINDGSIILFDNYSVIAANAITGEVKQKIIVEYLLYVDINGPKKPNVVGQDVFAFELPAKNGFNFGMYGDYYADIESWSKETLTVEKSTSDVAKICKKNAYDESSLYCGAWIRNNGWKIPDDYPWL